MDPNDLPGGTGLLMGAYDLWVLRRLALGHYRFPACFTGAPEDLNRTAAAHRLMSRGLAFVVGGGRIPGVAYVTFDGRKYLANR